MFDEFAGVLFRFPTTVQGKSAALQARRRGLEAAFNVWTKAFIHIADGHRNFSLPVFSVALPAAEPDGRSRLSWGDREGRDIYLASQRGLRKMPVRGRSPAAGTRHPEQPVEWPCSAPAMVHASTSPARRVVVAGCGPCVSWAAPGHGGPDRRHLPVGHPPVDMMFPMPCQRPAEAAASAASGDLPG